MEKLQEKVTFSRGAGAGAGKVSQDDIWRCTLFLINFHKLLSVCGSGDEELSQFEVYYVGVAS